MIVKNIFKLSHLYYASIVLGVVLLYLIQFHNIDSAWLLGAGLIYFLGFIKQYKNGLFANGFTLNKFATSLFSAYAIGLGFFMLSFLFGFISTHLVDFFWGENKGKLIFLYFLFALPFVWRYLKV